MSYKINNYWSRMNAEGEIISTQIGAREFDPDWDQEDRPYSFNTKAKAFVFAKKRDFDAAVARLEANGWIAIECI